MTGPFCRTALAGTLAGLALTFGAGETLGLFTEFMKAANRPGLIDARAKKLMAIALSLLSKCEPCVKIHVEEARKLGVSEEEITEAVWMAISFGGAPTMMFYRTMCEKS